MLLFADGYDHYGPNAAFMLNGVYAELNGVFLSSLRPRTGTRAMRIVAAVNNSGARKVLTEGGEDTVGAGFAFSINSLPTDNRSLGLFQWRTQANEIIASVWVSSTGEVVLLRGGRSGASVAVSNPVIYAGAYQHFEAKLTETGECEVRINGVTSISAVVPDRIEGQIAQVKIGANAFPLTGAIGIDLDVDDFVLWSGEGGVITDFVGDVKAYTRFPSSDGATQDWAPSVGATGWPMLDNVPPADGIEYLSAPPESVPARSTFGIADFPAEIVAVRGVVLATRAFKTDAGNAKLQAGVISGASTELSPEHALSQAPIWYADVFEADPATGSVWTLSALNDLNTVIDRTE